MGGFGSPRLILELDSDLLTGLKAGGMGAF